MMISELLDENLQTEQMWNYFTSLNRTGKNHINTVEAERAAAELESRWSSVSPLTFINQPVIPIQIVTQ